MEDLEGTNPYRLHNRHMPGSLRPRWVALRVQHAAGHARYARAMQAELHSQSASGSVAASHPVSRGTPSSLTFFPHVLSTTSDFILTLGARPFLQALTASVATNKTPYNSDAVDPIPAAGDILFKRSSDLPLRELTDQHQNGTCDVMSQPQSTITATQSFTVREI